MEEDKLLNTKLTLMPKEKVINADYQMKLVPGYTDEGKLSAQSKKELEAMIKPSNGGFGSDNSGEVSVESIRAAMGYKEARHTNQNQLKIVNTEYEKIKVRTYVQTQLVKQILPTIVFMHGGGFFGGSLDNVELPCEALADYGAVRVVSVDYSLAPEHPYPQNLLDCYQVLNYLGQHKSDLGINELIAMGDSAGGNLTYGLSLLDRRLGSNYLDKAIALYPVTYQGDNKLRRQEFDSPEPLIGQENPADIRTFVNNFNSSNNLINQWYLRDSDKESIYISPLNAPEDLLKKMPKTLFMVGEFDPLRLQGEAFYNKMKLAGGDITYIRYNGMTHAFMDKVGDFIQADDALMEALKFILN